MWPCQHYGGWGEGETFPRGLLLAEEEGKVPMQKTTLAPSCHYRAWGLSLGTVVRQLQPTPHAGSAQPSSSPCSDQFGNQ